MVRGLQLCNAHAPVPLWTRLLRSIFIFPDHPSPRRNFVYADKRYFNRGDEEDSFPLFREMLLVSFLFFPISKLQTSAKFIDKLYNSFDKLFHTNGFPSR